MTSVLVVDDHQLYREGLASELRRHEDFEVVGAARDAHQAYELAKETRPDLVVLDMSLPDTNGIAVIQELLRPRKHPQVMVLSGHVSPDYVTRAFAAGALGFALKDQTNEELLAAMRMVAAGQTYLAPTLAPMFPVDSNARERKRAESSGTLALLSKREREVFDLIVRGHRNRDIAKRLYISVTTVETHRARIFRKLSVHSTGQLVRFAAMHGQDLE